MGTREKEMRERKDPASISTIDGNPAAPAYRDFLGIGRADWSQEIIDNRVRTVRVQMAATPHCRGGRVPRTDTPASPCQEPSPMVARDNGRPPCAKPDLTISIS
jgi:hypothetical protein